MVQPVRKSYLPIPKVGVPWIWYRGHLGPSGPKLEKSLKMSSGAERRRGPKSRKLSRNGVKNRLLFFTIWALFRLRFRLFGPRSREVSGTHFRTPFQLWARRAQMTPVAGKVFATLRAQRLKHSVLLQIFSLAWNFQSRLKCSILTFGIPH